MKVKVIKVIFTILGLALSLLFYNFMFAAEEVMTIGIVDRIEDAGLAVVLIEAEAKQIELKITDFTESPEEGDVLQLEKNEDGYEVIRIDSDLSKERKRQVNDILQQLQNKQ